MSTYTLSRITDADDNNWDIKAKGLETQVVLSLTGNVTGSVTTDLSSNPSISTTIANNAVTNSKIADSAVSTGKIADGAVTLDKLADSVRSGSVSDNDGKLATHAQVKAAIDIAVSSGSVYRGQCTVATINSWTASNLNNGDRVIASDSGTVTLGNIPVVAGQELVFFKSGDVAEWQSSAGTYKLRQTAKSSPASSGTGLDFLTTITQNENGEITATKSSVAIATTSTNGLMTSAMVTKLNGISDSADAVTASSTNGYININGTSTKVYTHPTTSAVTAAAVKVGKDSSGHVVLGSALGISDIASLQDTLDAKQDAGNYKTVQSAVASPSASGTTTSFIDTISQNTNGVITVTKKTVVSASTTAKGTVQLSSTASSTDESKAATPKLVYSSIAALNVSDSAATNKFVTAVSESAGKISVTRAQPTIGDVSGLQTALDAKQATLTFDTAPTANSTNPVTSGGIKSYCDDKINALDVSDSVVSNQFVTKVSETDGKISVTRAQPTISNISGLQTALNGKEGTFSISYNASAHSLIFSKTFSVS